MKENNLPMPLVGLLGVIAGFVFLTVTGRLFIRYQKKCFRRTLEALAEDLKKGMPINDYDDDDETKETEEIDATDKTKETEEIDATDETKETEEIDATDESTPDDSK